MNTAEPFCNALEEGKTHIFSHELAALHHNTAVQVRRDIMFIGYTSMQRKGYDVRELIDVIGEILDSEKGLNVAVVGIGNLGRAVTTYFVGKRSKLNIIATFDVDHTKIDRVISGVKCYSLSRLKGDRGISSDHHCHYDCPCSFGRRSDQPACGCRDQGHHELYHRCTECS